MNPCGSSHSLTVIYQNGPEMEEDVIRWCTVCGAVVGDIDCDNRTQPGALFKMVFPKVSNGK